MSENDFQEQFLLPTCVASLQAHRQEATESSAFPNIKLGGKLMKLKMYKLMDEFFEDP